MFPRKKKTAEEKKPTKFYLKTGAPFNYNTDKLEDAKHNKCGGSPQWINATKGVGQCTSCRREFFPAPKSNIWRDNFYVEKRTEIDPTTLDPVYKYVDKSDGPHMYGIQVPLEGKELINWYYRGQEIVEE